MLIDGRSIPTGTTLRADVVVVGAGPAGITIAQQLAVAGRHVLLVEAAGRHHTRQDDDALDGDGSGDPIPLQRSRHRGFGGTSTHWTPATGLRVRPLDRIDFAARACRPSDAWPFDATELDSYYRQAMQAVGLDPDTEAPRSLSTPVPTPLVWEGGPQLALFRFADHDVFTRRFDDVVRAPHVDLLLHATARRLEVSPEGDAIARVALSAERGGTYFAQAEVFVVACGAIENARLLLLSPGRDGASIGNENDNVGRYFMDHLSVDAGVLVSNNLDNLGASVFRDPPADSAARFQAMLWLGEDIVERAGIANAAFWVQAIDRSYLSAGVGAARSLRMASNSRPRRNLAGHIARTLRYSPDLMRYAIRGARSDSSVLGLRILTEQLPNRQSRIRLSPRRDLWGMQRVDVDWRVASADVEVVLAHQELIGRMLADRGIATLSDPFDPDSHMAPVMSNYHHLGTTRMHRDPRFGVVDQDCRVHSMANLYVAGGSVFPTGGYVNPTLTIIALALRLAAAITARSRRVPALHADWPSSRAPETGTRP